MLKEQLDLYGLTLDNVGVQFIQSNKYHKQDKKTITLGLQYAR